MNADQLLSLARAWANTSKDDLIGAGVITGNEGGSDWTRFNSDPIMFILKLPRDRREALCRLLMS